MRFRIPIVLASALVVLMGALGAGSAAAAAPAAKQGDVGINAVTRYWIFVHTANIQDAGTDATVRMKVYGTLAESPGYVNLDNSVDNFERNSNDTFGPFSWFDIGRPDFIGVYKGSNGSEWYPEYAMVYSEATRIWYQCPMNAYYGDGEETRWFDCP
ncbi:PLAT/LH2 domain-containing protein [Micromonospora sp. NPDC049523]|uniref:PLAT/LH2 domain-containing protein n=1 Tax=Micromonospora sp. NPDC049523 TaxID=3155921 RepID=UPI0034306962